MTAMCPKCNNVVCVCGYRYLMLDERTIDEVSKSVSLAREIKTQYPNASLSEQLDRLAALRAHRERLVAELRGSRAEDNQG